MPTTVKIFTSVPCERPVLNAFNWAKTCTTVSTAPPCSISNQTCSKGSKCGSIKSKTPIVKLKMSDKKKKFTCRVKKLKYTPIFKIQVESANQWSELTADQLNPLMRRGAISGVRGKGPFRVLQKKCSISKFFLVFV